MDKLLNGIGLGTFPFASPFTPVDQLTSSKILNTFLDNGGQYIDTAPTYSFGEVESFLGKALKSITRSKFFICTSCGYILNDTRQFEVSGKYEHVIKDCEGSLKRLGLDYIDLYILHIPDPKTPFAETIGAMEELKKQGKARKLGVSNVTLDQLKEYKKHGSIEYVQNRFSLLNQNLSAEFIKYCEENNVGLTAYQVIERGLLTNKAATIVLREGDLRNKKPEFAPNIRERIGRWVAQYLLPIANELKVSVSTLAIWWALRQPAVALCQVGATSEKQVLDTIKVLNFVPPSDTLDRINKSYGILEEEIKREYSQSIREFMGLAQYNLYSGSASGKVPPSKK